VKYVAAVLLPIIAGLFILVAVGGTRDGGFAVSGIAQAILSMVLIGSVMSGLYFGLLLLMRSSELHGFLAPLRARFRR
jgi:putative peptidoglycan lipid II flippase